MPTEQLTPPPAGFKAMNMPAGFNQALQPIYLKMEGNHATLGFYVTARQCNSLGICHGGALMTFADIAMSAGMALSQGYGFGAPTMNMSMDFLDKALPGEWITSDSRILRVTYRTGFVETRLMVNDRPIARASGIFRLPTERSAKAPD